MSWFRRLFQSSMNPTEHNKSDLPFKAIPVVSFDPSLVTDVVKSDLRKNLRLISDLDTTHFERIYAAALQALLAGGDLYKLHTALMECEGMSKEKAKEIALLLNHKAMSLISRERQRALGIIHAVWMYSGAPCMSNPKAPTEKGIQQDAAHCAANGKRYEITKGLLVDEKWTWPGVEDGCKCSSRAVLPGFEK